MRALLGLKAYPSRISLQIMLVEPYICEMTHNSVCIDEIGSQYAYLHSYVSEPGRLVDSDVEPFDCVRVIRGWLGCGSGESSLNLRLHPGAKAPISGSAVNK
jgi:hypothetical protein